MWVYVKKKKQKKKKHCVYVYIPQSRVSVRKLMMHELANQFTTRSYCNKTWQLWRTSSIHFGVHAFRNILKGNLPYSSNVCSCFAYKIMYFKVSVLQSNMRYLNIIQARVSSTFLKKLSHCLVLWLFLQKSNMLRITRYFS